MKFTTAWENIIKENMHLKIMAAALLVVAITLMIATCILALRPATIIERGCYSKAPILGEAKQTKLEYEEFLKSALKQRFNSNEKIIEGYLSIDEKRKKQEEQQALHKNELIQLISVRKVNFKDNEILVDLDRTYSIKKVRSTLAIKVKVTLETKDRTQTNPYGLILVNTEELKEQKDKK